MSEVSAGQGFKSCSVVTGGSGSSPSLAVSWTALPWLGDEMDSDEMDSDYEAEDSDEDDSDEDNK